MALRHGAHFGLSQPQGLVTWRFISEDGFVDSRGQDLIGNDAGLREQRLASRALARQDKRCVAI
jgi:hypothetical protein